jgi:hypothetical protein
MADHPELAEAISRDLNKMQIAHTDLINPLPTHMKIKSRLFTA